MPHMHIEKGVELPEAPHGKGKTKHQDMIELLLSMEVGDSFTVAQSKRNSLESVIGVLRQRGTSGGRRYALRKEDNVTARVWRTE